MSRIREWIGLLVWIGVSFVPAWVGARATDPGWYAALEQPGWAPPTWLFSPAWTLLYLLMGIAAWMVWRRAGFRAASTALVLFLIQLVFNAGWSWLFFGIRRPDLAFAEIVLLWALILATLLAFRKHHRAAAWLLVPYLLWVAYAAALNFSLWQLNS